MNTKKTYWTSPLNDCDICKRDFKGVMYDANILGTWGNVCQRCFRLAGGQTGTGLGQKYELQENSSWLCTEGSIEE